MAGTWKFLKNVAWSSGNTIDSGTFDGQEFVKVMSYTSGANIEPLLRLNSDSGSNQYTTRRSNDGTGSDQANATFFKANATGGDTANAVFTTATIKGISTERKLAIINQVAVDETGVASGDEPRRAYSAGVWFNSSDKITSVQIYNNSTGSFTSGDFISVWGASSDTVTDEKDSLTNIPANTRYEETDTRKIYRRKAEGTFTSTDYTTSNFTAVGSTVAITSNSAVSTSTPSNTDNRVYATIPSLKSTDAWSCDFQLYVTADETNDYHTIAFCTNSDAFNTSGQNHISVQTQGGSYDRFVLNGRIGGSNSETATSSSTRSLSTNYYCTLSSDGAGTARMRIWTNSNRTGTPAQDKTLSIANIGTLTTVMHGTRNSGDTNVWSGTVSNVSLTNPAKWIERNTAT